METVGKAQINQKTKRSYVIASEFIANDGPGGMVKLLLQEPSAKQRDAPTRLLCFALTRCNAANKVTSLKKDLT